MRGPRITEKNSNLGGIEANIDRTRVRRHCPHCHREHAYSGTTKEESDRTPLLLRAFPAALRLQLDTHTVHRTDAAAVWGSRYTHICIHHTSNEGKYCSTVRHKTKPAVSPSRNVLRTSPASPTELTQRVKHLI